MSRLDDRALIFLKDIIEYAALGYTVSAKIPQLSIFVRHNLPYASWVVNYKGKSHKLVTMAGNTTIPYNSIASFISKVDSEDESDNS
nr:MAG TPA: hypothetical protein [Caudoviricetes sp.]